MPNGVSAGEVSGWLEVAERLWFQIRWRWRWLHVEVSPFKRFPKYLMMQLWVRNVSNLDAHKVRAEFTWRRIQGPSVETRTGQGLWTKKQATGLAGYEGVAEAVDLSTNQEPQHLAFIVREPNGPKAYLASTGSYHSSEYPNWQHPGWLIVPGVYDVEVKFIGQKGRKYTSTVSVIVHADGDIIAVC